MSRSKTIEDKLLDRPRLLIAQATKSGDERLQLLEEVSCLYSGLSVAAYSRLTGYSEITRQPSAAAMGLREAIDDCGIPSALALASLAREESDEINTKKHGAIYTDFRLAAYLAKTAMASYESGPILDLSCGTSIILAACANWAREHGQDVARFVSTNLYGVDLSAFAIRGSLLALSSMLTTEDELALLTEHFICDDSLILGSCITEKFNVDSFNLVVGNPPWERVRPSRNEYAKAHGSSVKYGEVIHEMPAGYKKQQAASRAQSAVLSKKYHLKGGVDLYCAFLNLSTSLCDRNGSVALYLPAGLIRSIGLAGARETMLLKFGRVRISVFMNRPKYFAIDSRFKFVLAMMNDCDSENKADCVRFSYCDADERAVRVVSLVSLSRAFLSADHGKLGVPEVKTDAEAEILKTIWDNSKCMSQHALFSNLSPVRELDMTLDRNLFLEGRESQSDSLPVIEGRMVSQYRCGCKEYVAGTGRSAQWDVVPVGSSRISPHYYVPKSSLSESLQLRVEGRRVGFCDIAGQTNERAMQAAFIPSGCVCGNKVPTLSFSDENSMMLWLGIANSLVFDWAIRRYITTTINFFIIESMPFPNIELDTTTASSIVASVQTLIEMKDGDAGWGTEEIWAYALERARLDASVFEAYHLKCDDFDIIIGDFPLIDKVNAALSKGKHPTIDLMRYGLSGDEAYLRRAREAFNDGAFPYVPNEQMRGMLKKGREI